MSTKKPPPHQAIHHKVNTTHPALNHPIGLLLLALGLVLAGLLAYRALPVAPLPQVDLPTLNVQASLPGASAETMAATVATPLERNLGRIAGITEITSSSSLGSTSITLQFDLKRKVDDAAREVQAAIQATRPLLPSGMPDAPSIRKVNPADSPIAILALTSPQHSRGQLYDLAATTLAQVLAQVPGVGQVTLGGGALPAVRIDINAQAIAAQGLGLETLRRSIAQSSTLRPNGELEHGAQRLAIHSNSQSSRAADYQNLVLRHSNGHTLSLGSVATVTDSVQDLRAFGQVNQKPAVVLIVYKAPGANIIATVDTLRARLPGLQALLPSAVELNLVLDRTRTIRASIQEVQWSLALSVGLVLLVVLMFLRRWQAALVPSIAVPVSLIGTFGVMYLCGFSLNNLSLMALTIATGFVVDDAIVVQEHIMRHIERGKSPWQAALQGSREMTFTVLAMSLSLVAVFIPILLMDGLVGRFFHEFAVTLCAAIGLSLLVSLTLTPALSAHWLPSRAHPGQDKHQNKHQAKRWGPRWYRRSLAWCLRHRLWVLLLLAATVGLNVYLYLHIPKGFFPQQDTGRLLGFVRVDQSASYQLTEEKMQAFIKTVQTDPAVETVVGFIGGGRRSSGFMFITLKPVRERQASAQDIANRLRPKLARVPGASLSLVPAQDVRVGGRSTSAAFDFTLKADDLATLRTWEPKVRQALAALPMLVDVNTDDADKGQELVIDIDRNAAARAGLSAQDIGLLLNNTLAQRPIATLYQDSNQYRVVMGLPPQQLQYPSTLQTLSLINPQGQAVPLASVATVRMAQAPLSVSHDGGFASATISFGLAEGATLQASTQAILEAYQGLSPPSSLQGSFGGNAGAFKSTGGGGAQGVLIVAAIVAIYLVLGMLFESLVHPLTILSTLPSAGVGALLALLAFDQEFGVIALIAVLLLIGIVKKNAIMMIDLALAHQRALPPNSRLSPKAQATAAIYRAAAQRFRPIAMTTLTAMLGALPLALGSGDGAELRVPLGIAIVGGLMLSQVLTLYTTPVVFVACAGSKRAWFV